MSRHFIEMICPEHGVLDFPNYELHVRGESGRLYRRARHFLVAKCKLCGSHCKIEISR